MKKPAHRLVPVLAALLSLTALPAAAQSPNPSFSGPAFSPAVPVSAFARPAAWFDPLRLNVSTTVTVGSGWGGFGTNALQVTRLSYQFNVPLALRVSVGNTFGGSNRFGNGMFLEGFEMAYRPHPSFQINVQYHDVRSPLQISPYDTRYGFLGR